MSEDVRPMNVIEGGRKLLLEMAGKEAANVVSSVMARQASADKGGGTAQALAKPGVIMNSAIGVETRK